jgi:hypothetical protein
VHLEKSPKRNTFCFCDGMINSGLHTIIFQFVLYSRILTYLLMSIDEIRVQYYFPEDTRIMLPYHFNYSIASVTGVFD